MQVAALVGHGTEALEHMVLFSPATLRSPAYRIIFVVYCVTTETRTRKKNRIQ